MNAGPNQRMFTVPLLVTLIFLLGVLPAAGAELKIEIRQTYLLEEVLVDTTENQARGYAQTLRIPDKALLAVVFASQVS